MLISKCRALGVLTAVALIPILTSARADDVVWDYELSPDQLASSPPSRPWTPIIRDGGESQTTPDGLRLKSTQSGSALYQLTGDPWHAAEENTVEFEVAVEQTDGVEAGAQVVVADGAFLYVVNLPKAEMSLYRLVTESGDASLYKDGALIAEATPGLRGGMLTSRPMEGETKIYFGDGSSTIGGVSLWRSLRFANARAIHPLPSDSKPQAKLPVAPPEVVIDPATRYPHIRYQVPSGAPDDLRVSCAFRIKGGKGGEWTPADVKPLMTRTGWNMAWNKQKKSWKKGIVRERAAAGEERELIWMPYAQLPGDAAVDTEFRIQLRNAYGQLLGEAVTAVPLRNADVEVIDRFASGLPKTETEKNGSHYRIEKNPTSADPLREVVVYPAGLEEEDVALHYGPKTPGRYFVFLGGDAKAWVQMGDRPFDRLGVRSPPKSEIGLGVQHFTGADLAFLPGPVGTGTYGMRLSAIRFVPAPDKAPPTSQKKTSKLLVGYFEPYSWAFWHLISGFEDYLSVVRTYKAAGFDFMDVQFGRFGARLLYDSKVAAEDRFLARKTIGDQSGKDGEHSKSTKVWSLVKNTAPLRDMLRAADAEGMKIHANFGATNCYPGSPLESEFSKAHPELRCNRGNFLIFAEPKVQEYMLSIFREVLEAGAPGISLDFCRYPHGIENADDVTGFLRKLRAMADGFPVPKTILVRFPATGERKSECFDYRTWAKEKLVDYLCPSNIFATVLHFDVAPYVEAAKNTGCKVLPVLDTIAGGFRSPGPLLKRAAEVYRAGADGIYVYQPDAHVFYTESLREYMPLLKDPSAVEAFLKNAQKTKKLASKNIFLLPPSHAFLGGYRPSSERIRFWLEGDIGPEAEVWVGDRKIAEYSKYPYVLGDEATDAPPLLPLGTHVVRIRARDGADWFERSFTVTKVAPHSWN